MTSYEISKGLTNRLCHFEAKRTEGIPPMSAFPEYLFQTGAYLELYADAFSLTAQIRETRDG